MTRILSFSDCSKINLYEDEVLKLIEKCFIDYSNKKCELKSKIVLRKDNDSFFTTMPAIYDEVMSVKSIQRDNTTINQPSIRGVLILNDSKTGELLSVMDSTYLTAIRTGLTAYISLKNTSEIKTNGKSLSVIGIGNATSSFLKAIYNFKNEHKIRKIFVRSYKNHFKRVKEIFSDEFDVIEIFHNEELMDADIIVSGITSAQGRIVENYNKDWKDKVIIPIHVRGWEHFDNWVDTVTTDFYEQTKNWIRNDAVELGNIISKKVTVNKGVVLSYNYGGALIDLVIAKYIYTFAVKNGLGTNLDLWDMKSKYF